MKQLKFLMVALTLLMGISFTSCLNSDDNSDYTQQHFARVRQGDITTGYRSYFEDLAGNKLFPTTASLTQVEAGGFKMSSADFVLIVYKLIEAEDTTKAANNSGTTTPVSRDINLLGAVACDGPTPIIVEDALEMESAAVENAPIYTLNYSNGGLLPFLYDKEILFLPVWYRMENKQETLAQHKLNLICNFEDMNSESTEIVFYVRHNRGTDEKYEVINVANNGYDIKAAVDRFIAMTGKEPKTIAVKVKETGEYSSSNTLPNDYTVYRGDFKLGSEISKRN